MAKYSIILPVRNGGHYVKICVDSILAQTYTDFNFIVLDNCSTDGTLEWLLSLNDSRIKVIPSQKSLFHCARKVLLSFSQEQLIIHLKESFLHL